MCSSPIELSTFFYLLIWPYSYVLALYLMWSFFLLIFLPKEMAHCLGIFFFFCFQFFAMLVLRSCLGDVRDEGSYVPILESPTLKFHVQESHGFSKCKHWEVQREVIIFPAINFLLYTSNLRTNIRKSMETHQNHGNSY